MNHHHRSLVIQTPALLLLATSQFLLVLDSAIVNVALPSMQDDLHFARGGVTWVVNAYGLLFGGLLLLGGRLADVKGARRVFVTGLGLFGLASVSGALASSAGALVVARAAQGAGAALVAPAGLALALILFTPGAARNRALGLMGAAAGLGGASGAVIGGVLTQTWGWPAVLWINLPIVVLLLGGARRYLPAAAARTGTSLDLPGAVTATAGMVAVVYGLAGASTTGWTTSRTLGSLALGLVLLGTFAITERRVRSPLVPSTLLRLPGIRGANTAAMLSAMAMLPMWFLLTVYLQRVKDYGPIAAGAGVLPTVVMLVAFNSVAPTVIARHGIKRPLVVGLLVAGAGLAWQSGLGGHSYLVEMLGPQLVTGAGFGLAFVAGTVTATSDVPVEQSGIASGMVNTAQQLGGAIGLALLGAVATAGASDAMALQENLSRAFALASAFAFVAAFVAWTLIPHVAGRRDVPAIGAPGTLENVPTGAEA